MNFLWVYGSEAHPEEHPFQSGYESKDLGWEHPYTISLEMQERAQRAKWMKTDPNPDFEIPMMVDYVNYPPHQNDEVRGAYRGGGFYSGFVIDCDGMVKRAENWGWFSPGGEWWGLPLAPLTELHDYLDAYLANPPTCYGQSDADGGPQEDGGTMADGANDQPDDEAPVDDPSGSNNCASSSPSTGSLGLLGLGWILLVRRRQGVIDCL